MRGDDEEDNSIFTESPKMGDKYDDYRLHEVQKRDLRVQNTISESMGGGREDLDENSLEDDSLINEHLQNNPSLLPNNLPSPLPPDLLNHFEHFQILCLLRECSTLKIFDKIPHLKKDKPSHERREDERDLTISISELSLETQCEPSILYRVLRALSFMDYTTLSYQFGDELNTNIADYDANCAKK